MKKLLLFLFLSSSPLFAGRWYVTRELFKAINNSDVPALVKIINNDEGKPAFPATVYDMVTKTSYRPIALAKEIIERKPENRHAIIICHLLREWSNDYNKKHKNLKKRRGQNFDDPLKKIRISYLVD